MKLFAILILAGIGYGLVLFLRGLIKELALFAVEAWRDVEIRQ
jgi:Na+/H+ antiporter NhaA